jgi:elongation factor P
MATTADFKNGICIEFNNELYKIVDFQHVKPGKGPAFVRTKLKNLKTGKVIPNTFNSGVKIDIARVEIRPNQFLYKENEMYHFMNTQTYEQTVIEHDLINAPELLKEGQEVEIMIHADTETPLSCDLPAFVVLKITYTEPGERGNTATNVQKPAKLETGATINVPLFVNSGELIRVDTRTNSYVERVKE